MLRQRKNAETSCNEKRKAVQQLKQKVQVKEINQKVLVKKGRLKRHRDRIKQYRQNRIFQNNEKKILQRNRG